MARTGRLAKRAAGTGLPKMIQHTVTSTEWIVLQRAADEIATATVAHADVILADRAAPDALAYLYAALEYRGERCDRLENERLRLLVTTQVPKATVLDESMPADKCHDYDIRYRRLVDQHVHRLLAEDAIPHHRVTSDHTSQTLTVLRAVELCLSEAAV